MFGKVSTLPIIHTISSFIHVQNIATWQNIHPHHQIFYLHGNVYYKIILYIGQNIYIFLQANSSPIHKLALLLKWQSLLINHLFDMWQHSYVPMCQCFVTWPKGRQVQYKTMCGSSIQYETPMLFVIGFIFLFTIVRCDMLTIINDNCFSITLHKGW